MTRFAFQLIAIVTPPSDRDSIVWDTQERFDELSQVEGLPRARRWLWRETARVICHAPRHHLAIWQGAGFGITLEERMTTGGGRIAKWGVLGLVAAGAVTGYVLSGAAPEYQSQATISVTPSRISEDVMRISPSRSIADRLATITTVVLSRTKLERLIRDFNLFADERKSGKFVMQDLVEKMHQRIELQLQPTPPGENGRAFTVSFKYPDRMRAQQVAERLAALIIDESLNDAERLAANTTSFVDAQVAETGRRLDDVNVRLAQTKTGADAARLQIEAEVIRESYKALVAKREQSTMRLGLERRQVGEQLALIDQARLPERPVGPTRGAAAIAGALAGLGVALVVILFFVVRRTLAARARAEVATS